MEINYYNLCLIIFTFINNFNVGMILTFLYGMLVLINHFVIIDKYYSEDDFIDRFTKKTCMVIFNKSYSQLYTLLFAIVYIFFIEQQLYPLFEICITCISLYHIFKYDDMSNLRIYVLFVIGCLNCLIYEYYISKFFTVILLVHHMKLFHS